MSDYEDEESQWLDIEVEGMSVMDVRTVGLVIERED